MARGRRGLAAVLAIAGTLGAARAAGGDEITYWTGSALLTTPDPRAAPAARPAAAESAGALIAEDVGLFIKPAAGASSRAFRLVAGAIIRRFSGHVPLHRVLGAGRILTLKAALTASGRDLISTWGLFDSDGARLETFRVTVRMSGAPAPGRPFAAVAAADAERLAFQVAAVLDASGGIGAAEALARLERAPTPAPRPGAEGGRTPLSFPPPPAPQGYRTALPAPLSRPE